MTAIASEFLHLDRQNLFPRTVGEVLARYARTKWQRDTAKHASREWGVDPTTASNLIKGNASERTITKALRSEGWPLFMALGEAMTGEAYTDFLQGVVDEQNRAKERAEQRQSYVRHLEASALRLVEVDSRPAA